VNYARPASATDGPPLAAFGDLRLLSVAFPARTEARDRDLHPPSAWLPVSLSWQATALIAGNYRPVLELVDGRGVWGRSLERDGDLFHKRVTSSWEPARTMIDSADLNLNPDTPPGRYVLQLALFDDQGQPVPSSAGGPVQLGEVEVVS
jgi:hypothetical protein